MKQGLSVVALIALTAAALWYSLSPQFPVALGLDLKGGMRVTLEADPTKSGGENASPNDMRQVRDVLKRRVNNFGLTGTDVRLKSADDGRQAVVVMLPEARDPDAVLQMISTVGQFEVRQLQNVQSKRNPTARYKLEKTTGNAAQGEPDTLKFIDTENGNLEVSPEVVLATSQLVLKSNSFRPTSQAQLNPTTSRPLVTFQLDPDGTRAFATHTTENVNGILAFVLDGKIVSTSDITEPITDGRGQLSGGFRSMTEARTLAHLVNSGALSVPVRAAKTLRVGAALGPDTVGGVLRAGAIGLALVAVVLLISYRLLGLLALFALIFHAAVAFALFKGAGLFPPIVLDWPGITGFLLSFVIALDANILIFERLKEELKAGKSIHEAIDAGWSRALSAIFDASVAVWIVCGMLVWWGVSVFQGFALALAVGVAVSLFMAAVVTRMLLHGLLGMPWAGNRSLYALDVSWVGMLFPAARRGVAIPVYSRRRLYLGAGVVGSIAGLLLIGASFFGYGLKPGLDFTGGTVVEAAFRNANVSREEVAGALNAAGVADGSVNMAALQQAWTRVDLQAAGVDPSSEPLILARLAQVGGGFDESRFVATREGETYKATAFYLTPVTEADVRRALSASPDMPAAALNLENLQVQTAPQPSTDGPSVPIALIRVQQLPSHQLPALKEKLSGVGGGLVEPLYQVSSIGPSVGRDVIGGLVGSLLAALLAIMLYLALRFTVRGVMNGLGFGLGTGLALVQDVVITLGVFALLGQMFGWRVDGLLVTAALATAAYSLYNSIVTYDRLRENLRHRERGETLAEASDRSITQTFDRSVNTALAALLMVAALVVLGGEPLRLFGIVLLFGVAIATGSSIFMASSLPVAIEERLARRQGREIPVAPRPVRREEAPAAPARRDRPAPASAAPRSASVEPAKPETAEDASERGERARTAPVKPRRKRRM